jgi:sec-independent protein translocase protein TatB
MSELGIIFGLALVVLGPKKLPGLVQQVGRWVGRARHMARQFREQLEQEVNAINEVKPVPRHVPPDVGPAAPGAPPPPDIHNEMPTTEVTGVVEPEVAQASPPDDVHPEAQIYFAMNGSQPDVSAESPYAAHPAAEDPQAALDPAVPAAPGTHPATTAEKTTESNQPASVEVVFPHDHG